MTQACQNERKPNPEHYLRDDLLEVALYLVQRFHPKNEIRRQINAYVKEKYGIQREMSKSTFATLVARARTLMRERATQTRKDMRMESRQFYEGMIADPSVDDKVKLKARESLDRLYGLPMGFNVHYSGKVEQVSTTNVTHCLGDKTLDELAAMRAALARALPAGHEPIIMDQPTQVNNAEAKDKQP